MNLFADERRQAHRGAPAPGSHDVTYVPELAPSITDDEVLREANRRSAVLVTADKDFGELLFRQGVIHSRVVLLRLAGLANQAKSKIVAEV